MIRFTLLAVFVCAISIAKAEDLRVGIIGLDTSHVIAFTKVINAKDAEGDLAKMRVVAAYPGGSPDIDSSRNRIEGFTNQLREQGIEIVDSVAALLSKVDAVLLESVDGRPHLKQAIPVFQSGKRCFIDKPLAGSLVDCLAIDRVAKKHDAQWFSSSSLRFSPDIHRFRDGDDAIGDVKGALAWSPCSLEKTHPDLYWYGVHGVETLFTIMGPGCEQVSRVSTAGIDQATGIWEGGRVGTFRGIRDGKSGYGGIVFGSKSIGNAGSYAGYKPLVEKIAHFFLTGESPVATDETLEMFAFMTAADVSKREGGRVVSLKEVIADAEAKVDQRIQQVMSEIAE